MDSLGSSPRALCEAYDLAMLDLDGVVYVGDAAVPGAAENIDGARRGGMRIAFITNNASRPPETVASHLRDLGVDAHTQDVVTSAQAAAGLLAVRLGPSARVVCLGGAGLEEALIAAGLVPVGVDADAAAVATGYGPDIAWRDIMRVAVRVRDGLAWVATNADMTIPTPYGVAPGHGVLVETLSRFSGVDPVVAGKPSAPLLEETMRRVGGARPLMVGDRLDTDIEGAANLGIDSLLVLTGVTDLSDLVTATAGQRPTYISLDLAGLQVTHPGVDLADGVASSDGWQARVTHGRLSVTGEGTAGGWWRAAAVAAWAYTDSTGQHVDIDGAQPPR
ncbi:HAD-IIA family hydrolase [Nocardioides sp.]|uniref:HAD-IIA family hydrolase n=1 Tax=Nocardioides sp. TaxID=35761 RepID=UPI003568DF26